jgi:iron complex transport system ATP-binding protein
MKTPPIFEARGLCAGPGDFLRDLEFQIEPGEWIFVIGPNGSGKTTLLDALTGWIPHRGSLRFQGQPLPHIPRLEFARSVAVLRCQEAPVFGFSVGEFVESGAFPQGPHGARAIARESLEQVGALDWLDRPLTSLSSGEFQRIALARVLAQQTPVLLLDEPTSHLDPGHHAACFELLAQLRAQTPKTILCICHDLSAAAQYGDRLLLLSRGRIVAQGGPRTVLTGPHLQAAYGCPFEFESSPAQLHPRAVASSPRPFSFSP